MGGIPGPEVLARGVDPDAAIEFWRQRANLTDVEAKALGSGAKHRAFYVTGLARHDLVQLVSEGLQSALENGDTLPMFKKSILAAIQSEGWHDYRIENIFRTNLQTAYSAGRYKKMQTVKQARPYWQYLTVEDKRRRPSHAVLQGAVYPADHEFWGTNYPPNGFRCRCCARTLSARQVEALGLDVQTEMPGDSQYTDPKTGMEYHVARPGADDGFRNNPGKDWMAGLLDVSVEKLEASDPALAAATVRTLAQGGLALWAQQPSGNFPLAVLGKADAARIASSATVARLSPETYAKQMKRHPELTLEDYLLVQDIVEQGEKYQQGDRNLAFVLNQPGGMVVIVKATMSGKELYVTSLYRISRDDLKREMEVKRLKKVEADGRASPRLRGNPT